MIRTVIGLQKAALTVGQMLGRQRARPSASVTTQANTLPRSGMIHVAAIEVVGHGPCVYMHEVSELYGWKAQRRRLDSIPLVARWKHTPY